MAKVRGVREHLDRVKRLTGPEMVEKITQVLYVAADNIKADAQISITNGAVSGKNHVPSAPGTPPNNDSGVLAGNIEAAIVGPAHAQVSSNAPYAAAQEFGATINHPGGTAYFIGDDGMAKFVSNAEATADMPRTKPHTITLPERPYMRPAAAKNREATVKMVRDAVSRIVGKKG